MSKKVEFKGKVEKISMASGKADAQMVVSIPIKLALEIPLGHVVCTVQTLQSAMFDADGEAPVGKKSSKSK